EILDSIADQKVILIVNKLDLDNRLDIADLESRYPGMPVVKTSIVNSTGVDELEEKIADLFFDGSIQSTDSTYVSNNRHISLLEQAKQSVSDAVESAEMDVPVDIIQ